MSLFIQQPQHHPSSPPFALHPVRHTITLNASASVNTRRLSGIKKIAEQGEEKKEWRREGSKKRSGAKKRLGPGEVQLFQSWLGSWQKAREGISAQVLAAVTFSATDGKQIHVKKQNSPREKPGSTYQTTANGNCLAALFLSNARNCDLEGEYLLRQHKAMLSMLDMSDLA